MLCGSNRTEGFGPQSSIASPIPTSCVVDVILVPLPVWIALALLLILFLLSIHHRKANYDPSTAHLRAKPKRDCLFSTTSALYYILVICNILMQTLEIVRLELIHYGCGLLPFVYVGLIAGALLHWTEGVHGRTRGWQTINAVVWIGGIVMTSVKVVGLSNEGIDGRKPSKYPVSDQVIDVAVMAGVYAVITILELVLGFWRTLRRARSSRESVQSASPVMVEQWIGK